MLQFDFLSGVSVKSSFSKFAIIVQRTKLAYKIRTKLEKRKKTEQPFTSFVYIPKNSFVSVVKNRNCKCGTLSTYCIQQFLRNVECDPLRNRTRFQPGRSK